MRTGFKTRVGDLIYLRRAGISWGYSYIKTNPCLMMALLTDIRLMPAICWNELDRLNYGCLNLTEPA